MLNYHPSGDSYHCIYRLFFLTHSIGGKPIEWERLRLMDFYFLFPHLIKKITIPNQFRQHRQIFKRIPEPFEEISSPKRLFFQTETIQKSSIRSLVAKGYFDRDSFLSEMMVIPSKSIPKEILTQIALDPKVGEGWLKPFLEIFSSVALTGNDGLKSRSKMMEYRYDAR